MRRFGLAIWEKNTNINLKFISHVETCGGGKAYHPLILGPHTEEILVLSIQFNW